MKKVLLTVSAIALGLSSAMAQCTPDPSLAGSEFGLYPDTIPTIYTCAGCGGHTRVIDFVAFTDTATVVLGNTVTIYIDAFKVVDVTGVPAGLTYGTNLGANPNFGEWLNTGTIPNQTGVQGCVYITGGEAEWNAAAGSVHPLVVNVDARIGSTNPPLTGIINPGTWLSAVPANLGGGLIPISTYFLDVRASGVGITEYDRTKFTVLECYPNPFSNSTNIRFHSPKAGENVEFSVYGVLGNRISSKNIQAEEGLNKFDFDGSSLSAGVYFYTLKSGSKSVTKKFTVK